MPASVKNHVLLAFLCCAFLYRLPAQGVEFINTGYFSKTILDSVGITRAYQTLLEPYPSGMRDSLPLVILYDPWFENKGKRWEDHKIQETLPDLYQRYASGHLIYILSYDHQTGDIKCVDAELLYPESAGANRSGSMRDFVIMLELNQLLKRYRNNPYFLPTAFDASFRRLDQLMQDEIYKSRGTRLAEEENRQYFKGSDKH